MEDLGTLRKSAGRYEFSFPELGLIVRGAYAEWVLEAAGEIIAEAEKLTEGGKVEELEMLVEFGEADEMDVDSAKFDFKARFEAVPQCVVTMGDLDYRWMSKDGREEGQTSVTRVIDMSATRNDTFLENEEGVGEGHGDRGL